MSFTSTEEWKKELNARKVIERMDDKNDFGFSFTDPEKIEEVKDYADKQVKAADALKTDLARMHSLFSSLLSNLAQNPDKDIHWPDRDKKIAEIQAKIDEMLK
jgi:hypothetical protein